MMLRQLLPQSFQGQDIFSPLDNDSEIEMPKSDSVLIECKNLVSQVEQGKFWKKNIKTLLDNVSVSFNPGELTAILGPSGAGKTTLNNILSGYEAIHISGDIKINGKLRDLKKFRKMSVFIMQDDCLLPHLTVTEAMLSAATMKLSENVHEDHKICLINKILKDLGLSECVNTRTSMLSGGQRKRLAIAQELINNPPVMIFDEPTSGLDSATSFQVMKILKSLAHEGRTIICTIHQPSARLFELFDSVIILCNGQTLYNGPTWQIVPYFKNFGFECPFYHNPADFIIEVASEEHGPIHLLLASNPLKNDDVVMSNPNNFYGQIENVTDGKCSNEMKSEVIINDESQPTYHQGASKWTRFRSLLYRTYLCIIRDKTLTALRIIMQVAIAILLGYLYYDIGNEANRVTDNSSMLFYCLLFSMLSAMMPTIMTFPLEMKTFKREHHNNWYSLTCYYIAKSLADLPFQVIYPTVFISIVYFMTSQPVDVSRISMVISMFILTSLVAQSLGLLIGCASDAQTAVFLGPLSVIPTCLFSGFFISLQDMPGHMDKISYLTYVRFGMNGIIHAIYNDNRTTLNYPPECANLSTEKIIEEIEIGNWTSNQEISNDDRKKFGYKICEDVRRCWDPIPSILEHYGSNPGSNEFYIDFISLVVFFITFRLLGGIILWYRIKRPTAIKIKWW